MFFDQKKETEHDYFSSLDLLTAELEALTGESAELEMPFTQVPLEPHWKRDEKRLSATIS